MNKIFALGFFDGVHLGHQALLARCCAMARELDAQACAITFQQHPQSLFLANPPKLINSCEDRLLLLRQYGIGPVISYPVVEETMSTPWEAFLNELVSFDAAGFVCGSDFRFGNRGEGNAQKLAAYCRERNLACCIVEEQLLDGIRVSSTHIRKLLEAGKMEEAVRFSGHPHILTGPVVPGRALGRTMGIPTANIAVSEEVVLPKSGVYACRARVVGETYCAVTNIGSRPTVGGSHITVEPWLLDYEGDLYGKPLTLEFYKFLRPEKKFDSLELLQAEILRNAEQTRQYFAHMQ